MPMITESARAADDAALRDAGVAAVGVEPDRPGMVSLWFDARSAVHDTFLALADQILEAPEEITDRLTEFAWLQQRAEGLRSGRLDPELEEIEPAEAEDRATAALDSLLDTCGIDRRAPARVVLFGTTAHILRERLDEYAPPHSRQAREAILLHRSEESTCP